MKIVVKYNIDADEPLQASLRSLGIEVDLGFTSVLAPEDHPNFSGNDDLLSSLGASKYFQTTFSRKEELEADHCGLFCKRHVGYPQPEDLSFREAVYGSACSICGSLGRQVSPFRIKKSVFEKGIDIFQLNWVFDEFFVSKRLYEDVFSDAGVEHREVVCSKSGLPSDSHVQIIVPKLDFGFDTSMLTGATCTQCGTRRVEPHTRGRFPRLEHSTELPIFAPKTVFGSDKLCRNQVVVSKPLRERIERNAPRLLQYCPLEP